MDIITYGALNGKIKTDGSPKGAFDTLVELQTAYPTGAEGTYVVKANGHWYYWSGVAWEDGGLFIGIIEQEALDLIEQNSIEITKNLNISLIQTFNGNPRLRKAEDKAVVTHFNGSVVFTSVGATTTQIAANDVKISCPSTPSTYSSVINASRNFGVINKKYIEFKLKCDDWSKLTAVTLDIVPVSASPSNYYRKVFNISEFASLINGHEKTFKAHVDSFAVVGTPSELSLNTTGRISIALTNSGAVNVNVLDGIISSNSPNYHMIQFDDGLSGVYDYAFPIMKKLGIVGTAFVNTSQIGDVDHMTMEQLHELQNNGWTIGSHAHTHINLVSSPKDLAIEAVELGAKVLAENGFRGAHYLAAPYNAFDSTIAPYVSHAVNAVRIGMSSGIGAYGSIYIKKSYPASTLGYSILNTETVQDIYNKYILAKDKNVLYSFLFHNFAPVADTTYKWTPSNFESLLTMLKEDGVMFINFEEYMTAYLERNDDYPNYY